MDDVEDVDDNEEVVSVPKCIESCQLLQWFREVQPAAPKHWGGKCEGNHHYYYHYDARTAFYILYKPPEIAAMDVTSVVAGHERASMKDGTNNDPHCNYLFNMLLNQLMHLRERRLIFFFVIKSFQNLSSRYQALDLRNIRYNSSVDCQAVSIFKVACQNYLFICQQNYDKIIKQGSYCIY